MNLKERAEIFSELSNLVFDYFSNPSKIKISHSNILSESIKKATQNNPWFGYEEIEHSLLSICESITYNKIITWLNNYPKLSNIKISKNIGIVMAGNIPLVGFMDFFYVIMSGNNAIVKLSSDDNILFPAIIEILKDINPKIDNYINIVEQKISGFEAIIATGSNNTSRYFEYYFGKYPNIIRKNRNSIAILKGDESLEELIRLADDITTYFGLGCRNVSKILVPNSYNFEHLITALGKKSKILDFYKYKNNYDYQKSILIINRTPFYDCGSVLLTQNSNLSSPISVVYYDYYNTDNEIANYLEKNKDSLQCIVGKIKYKNIVKFGKTQSPELGDYSDNVDVMEFLLNL